MQFDLTTPILAADWAFLMSPYKPFLAAAIFIPWAWLVSSVIDKDAMYFHLNRPMWNGCNLAAGAVAALGLFLIPIFWIGFPVTILVLLTPVLVYWKLRNDAVPENKRFYLSSKSITGRLEQRRAAAATRGALLTFTDAAGERREVPLKESPMYETHLLAEDLLAPAADARASKIEMVPGPNGYVVMQTVDGVRYKRDPIAPDAGNLLIDYLKGITGQDVQNRRRRQVGTMHMDGPNGRSSVTITTAGSSKGQEVRVEFNRTEQLDKPFDGLGLLRQQVEALRTFEAAHERHGIILLGAPGGHGLTTMGFAFIGRHDAYTTNIKTLEREIYLRKDGVDHVEFDASNPDLDFATNLQSILRRDPDIVLVGDVMDKGTAAIAAQHAADGPLVYVPQRLPGVREQIVDWVKRVGEIQKAVAPLRAVVNGRVLRTLCPNCRQPYQPTPEQLKKLNLPPEKVKQLYKASGKVQVKNKIENCPICQGTGYFGQVGIYEAMIVDRAAQKLIVQNDLQGAYTHSRRNGMHFLQEAAMAKVVDGTTSLEEVVRVLSPPKTAPKSPPEPQPAAT